MLKKTISYLFLLYILGCFVGVLFLSHPASHHILQRSQQPDIPAFSEIKNIKEKKKTFIQFISPLVETENKRISLVREQIQYLQKKIHNNEKLTPRERHYLHAKYNRYDVDNELAEAEKIDLLLTHINVVPSSLAIAQAAIESGWGTSRFARNAHNYFGQWCYEEGCGVTPSKRNASASHEVRKFTSPYESVAAYMFNINSHRAYADLRHTRKQLEENKQEISANRLAEDLLSYSELGYEYVVKVQKMIRRNNKIIASLENDLTQNNTAN